MPITGEVRSHLSFDSRSRYRPTSTFTRRGFCVSHPPITLVTLIMCRCTSDLPAVAVGVLTAVALQEHASLLSPALHDALAGTDLPPETRDTVAAVVLRVLPIAVPLALFAAAYAVFGVLGLLFSCGAAPIPVEAHYVRMPGPQRGAWSDGLFSCLNDVPICLVSCCLPPVIVGQLYERATRRRGSCVLIVLFVGGVGLAATAFTSTWCSQCSVSGSRGLPHISCSDGAPPPHVCGYINTASTACFLVMASLVILARAAIRREYHIAPPCGCDGCGGCDDCCVSVCCLPLAAAQATRHLQAVDSADRSFAPIPVVDAQRGCHHTQPPVIIQVQGQVPVPMGIPV